MSLIGETFLDFMGEVDAAVTSAIEETERKEAEESKNVGVSILDYLGSLDTKVSAKIAEMNSDDYSNDWMNGDGELGTTLEKMVENDLKDISGITAIFVPTIHDGYGMVIDTSDVNPIVGSGINQYYGMSFSDEVNQLIEKELKENPYEKNLIASRYYLQDYIDTSSYDRYMREEREEEETSL